jgi:hypothetical protein
LDAWGRLGRLATPGDALGRLGTPGDARGCLGTSGDAWRRLGTPCGPFCVLFTQFPTVPDALWPILCAIYAVPDSSRRPVSHFVRYLHSSRQFPMPCGPFCALFTQFPTVPDALWSILCAIYAIPDSSRRPVAHFVRYLSTSRHSRRPVAHFVCYLRSSRQFPTPCGPFCVLFTQFPTVPDALWPILCAIYAVPDSSRRPVAHFVRYLRSSRQFPMPCSPFCALFTQFPTVPDALWPILCAIYVVPDSSRRPVAPGVPRRPKASPGVAKRPRRPQASKASPSVPKRHQAPPGVPRHPVSRGY